MEIVRNDQICSVRYHKELYPELKEIEEIDGGNYFDLRAAETVSLKAGDFALISLGISVELPKDHIAKIFPRSSTFKNWGIIQTNSVGIIDESYCGDNDIWKMPVYATRDTVINVNDRICQFTIEKCNSFTCITVNHLNGPNRGGFGSTGIN